ncbi:MAG: hypothetical protein M0Q91_11360 [Methanoregula sp.]|nr:hypothetical protein [Methanoregula sp.]
MPGRQRYRSCASMTISIVGRRPGYGVTGYYLRHYLTVPEEIGARGFIPGT